MNFAFDIELNEEGDYATLYTFRIEGQEHNELERFQSDPNVEAASDYNRLEDRLTRMLDELGLYHRQADFGRFRYFRDEGDDVSALWAPIPREDIERLHLKEPYPSLRLYCFRLREGYILIAGSGGAKTSQRVHEDPDLHTDLQRVKYVKQRLEQRIEEGTVRLVEGGFLLEGDLYFEREELL